MQLEESSSLTYKTDDQKIDLVPLWLAFQKDIPMDIEIASI